jgi:hypothetical protein
VSIWRHLRAVCLLPAVATVAVPAAILAAEDVELSWGLVPGVALVLVGEAASFGSVGLLVWATAFVAVNAAWFPLIEERALERRFGEDYRVYKRAVPRWIPRLRPWDPP